jgi:hypothetical protein
MANLFSDITATSVIYVALCTHCNLCKIGTTNNLSGRTKTLRTANPYLQMLYFGSGSYLMEGHFHRLFEDKKVRGEWFDLDSEDIRLLVEGFEFQKIG